MIRPLNVPLPGEAFVELNELARRELRRPRDQAALLILDGLRRARGEMDASPEPRRVKASR